MLHSFVSPPSLSHTNTKYTCTHTHSHTSPTFSHLGELLFSRFQSICQLVILQNNERKIEVLMSVNEQIIYCYMELSTFLSVSIAFKTALWFGASSGQQQVVGFIKYRVLQKDREDFGKSSFLPLIRSLSLL